MIAAMGEAAVSEAVGSLEGPVGGDVGVVVIGSSNQDVTCIASHLPTRGETVLGDAAAVELSCGGKGANQAVAAASMGLCPVQFITRVADDVFGHNIIQHLRQRHVQFNPQTTMILQQQEQEGSANNKTSTGVATIIVETVTGDNCIVVSPGANLLLTPESVQDELQSIVRMTPPVASSNFDIALPGCLLVQLEIPLPSVLAALQTINSLSSSSSIRRVPWTLLNPAPARLSSTTIQWSDLLPLVDVLIPNESELRTIYAALRPDVADDDDDEVAMATWLLQNSGVRKALIVTTGARGALIVAQQSPANKDTSSSMALLVRQVRIPTDNIPGANDPVVDTVGAGDAFCGALAAYLANQRYGTNQQQSDNNKSDNNNDFVSLNDLVGHVERACGFASMSVRRKGASYPTADELPSRLRVPSHYCNNDQTNNNGQAASPPTTTITFVTGNQKKLEEVQKILTTPSATEEASPFRLVSRKIDIPELQGDSVVEIAKAKCRLAAQQIQGPCLIEDTSLCFHALGDLPGPYVKWFLQKCGCDGLVQLLAGFDDKTGYAQTVAAYTNGPDETIHVFDGRTTGTIVPPRTAAGKKSFGWDPIFQPDNSDLTYAEMTVEQKNSVSHRGKAFQQLQAFLNEHFSSNSNSKRM